MTTAIIILNYKNYKDTINCINSILESENTNYSIFVVDNGSQNYSLEKIYDVFEGKLETIKYEGEKKINKNNKLILIQNEQNTGYARGNNVGLKIAFDLGYKYSMVLNNDTRFENVCLDDLIEVFNIEPNIYCVGPVIINENGHIDKNCSRRRPKYYDFFFFSIIGKNFKTKEFCNNYYKIDDTRIPSTSVKVEIISGACMFFSSDLLNEIGYFDEKTFLYYEEAILYEKAREKKLLTYINPNVRIFHASGKSTSLFSGRNFLSKCEYESLIYYLTEYRKLNIILAFILAFGQFTFYSLKRLKDSFLR